MARTFKASAAVVIVVALATGQTQADPKQSSTCEPEITNETSTVGLDLEFGPTLKNHDHNFGGGNEDIMEFAPEIKDIARVGGQTWSFESADAYDADTNEIPCRATLVIRTVFEGALLRPQTLATANAPQAHPTGLIKCTTPGMHDCDWGRAYAWWSRQS